MIIPLKETSCGLVIEVMKLDFSIDVRITKLFVHFLSVKMMLAKDMRSRWVIWYRAKFNAVIKVQIILCQAIC